MTNDGSEGSFSGTLKLSHDDGLPEYGFSFGDDKDEITLELDAGKSLDFDVVLRTNYEVGKKFDAKVEAIHNSGVKANHFKIEATIKGPLKVEIKDPKGKWTTLTHHQQFSAPHLGVPPEDRVDEVKISNLSDVGVFVHNPTITHRDGARYVRIDNIFRLNRTLLEGESGTFDIVNDPDGCGLHSIDEITFEYGFLSNLGRTPRGEEFSFNYETEACVPRAVEFEWDRLPVFPPYRLNFELLSEPDGSASVRGTMALKLSIPAYRPKRLLTVTTSGSGFSDNAENPITLKENDMKEVTVRYRPTDFGTSSGTLTFKDSSTGYSWKFDLSGQTCGLEGKESCNGVCSDGLQECSDQTCRACCGNETNGLCGGSCSGEPGSMWYDFDCCPGTDRRWQSDFDGQVPFESPDQPSSLVCLPNNRCLSTDGSSVRLGRLNSDSWACGTEQLAGRLQGVWYQCEETRASAGAVIQGLKCIETGGTYKWALPIRRGAMRVSAFQQKISGQNVEGLRTQDTNPAIDFTWVPPDDTPAAIVKYQVVVQPTDGSGWLYSPQVRFPATRYTLQTANLQTERSYSTHIRVKFDDGEWGEFVRGGTFTVEADTTPPSIPGQTFSLDCLYTTTNTCFVADRDFVIRIKSAADVGSGVDPNGYRICRSHDATGWGGCNLVMTKSGGVAFTVSGAHRPAPGKRRAYYFRAKDLAGNLGPYNKPIYIQTIEEASDTTPPSAPGSTYSLDCAYRSGNTCFVQESNFVIRVAAATDSGSGVDRDGYRICRSNDVTGWGGCNVTMTWDGGVTFTVTGANRPAPGKRRAYYFRARDEAGNWGPWNIPLFVSTIQ